MKVRKESLFLRVMMGDEMAFEDVTRYTGKKSPYQKFSSIASARASEKIVSFTLQHVTKRSLPKAREQVLAIPRSPLSHLEGDALKMIEEGTLPDGKLIAKYNGATYEFNATRDASGTLSLDAASEDADQPFEVPKRPLLFDFFFRSPVVDRVLAVSFQGHMDRAPGDSETLARVVLKAVTALLPLADFQLLSGLTSVDLPVPPAAAPVAPAARSAGDVEFQVPTWLYDESGQTGIAGGYLNVKVDLEHANQATGRLLYNITPDAELEEHFSVYAENAANAVAEIVTTLMPLEEQKNLTFDIVLGDVTDGSVERLRDIVGKLSSTLLLTPKMYQAVPTESQ